MTTHWILQPTSRILLCSIDAETKSFMMTGSSCIFEHGSCTLDKPSKLLVNGSIKISEAFGQRLVEVVVLLEDTALSLDGIGREL